jgi:hypothetical protein
MLRACSEDARAPSPTANRSLIVLLRDGRHARTASVSNCVTHDSVHQLNLSRRTLSRLLKLNPAGRHSTPASEPDEPSPLQRFTMEARRNDQN